MLRGSRLIHKVVNAQGKVSHKRVLCIEGVRIRGVLLYTHIVNIFCFWWRQWLEVNIISVLPSFVVIV